MYVIGDNILGIKCGKDKTEYGEHICFVIYIFPFKIIFLVDNEFTDFRIELFNKISFSISLQIKKSV